MKLASGGLQEIQHKVFYRYYVSYSGFQVTEALTQDVLLSSEGSSQQNLPPLVASIREVIMNGMASHAILAQTPCS